MATQTGSIDLKAAKKAHDDAGKVATNYVTDISNGILVHPENDQQNGVKITNKVDILRSNVSVMAIGETNTTTGNDVVRIGKSGETRAEIDYHSLQLVSKEGTSYFHVSDLRDQSGYATISEEYIGDGSQTYFTTEHIIASVLSVKENGHDVSYTYGNVTVTLASPPGVGSTLVITYTTSDVTTKALTFGYRKSGSSVGGHSVAAGIEVIASGSGSHAEGLQTTASGGCAHAEGAKTVASGTDAHAEGYNTKATGIWAHSEGYNTKASGNTSHAEGNSTTASGDRSHAEGNSTTASGGYAHAEGNSTTASGDYSHSQNYRTIAQRKYQTALGEFNVADTTGADGTAKGDYIVIVGNGTSDNNRSNALTVAWTGDVVASGDITDGSGNVLSDKADTSIVPTMSAILDMFYPVGSYYETSDATFDPNTAWGGTWYKEIEGQVHVSAGSNYTVSGADTTSTVGSETRVGTNNGGSLGVPYHTHTLSRDTGVGVTVSAHGITQPAFKLTATDANGRHSGEYLSANGAVSYGTGKLDTSGTSYKYLRSSTSGSITLSRSSPQVPEKACTITTNVSLTNNHSVSVTQPVFSCNYAGTNGDNNMQPYIIVNRWHRIA